MSLMKDCLNKILEGKAMCALCLAEVTGSNVTVYDDTYMNDDMTKSVGDLVSFILGYEVNKSCQLMDSVCIECMKTAISSYTFIEMCRQTHTMLDNTLKVMMETLSGADDVHQPKAMYMTVDSHPLTCGLNYDMEKSAKNRRKAWKRYRSIKKKRKIKKVIKLEEDAYDPPSPGIVDIVQGDDNNVYTCKECLKIFRRSTNLRSHYLRVHGPKDFKCVECPKKFGSAYLLKLHCSESHISVMCPECGKTYDNIHSLKMHIGSHQEKICPTCGKQYKNRNSYMRHLKLQLCGTISTHPPHSMDKTPDFRYECDVCSKRFTQKGSLRVHINFVHQNGKAYDCRWCNKKFSAQSKLNAHVVKHTRERNFTCEICGGKFVTKEALLYHRRIHTGEKPYPCSQCNERFLSASRRMEHLRRKHWGPTLECDICSSRFNTSFCLKKHKLRHYDPNSRLFTQKTLDGVEV